MKKHKWDKEIRALLDGERVAVYYTNMDGESMQEEMEMDSLTTFDLAGMTFKIMPKTISINGYEFPEPLRVAPEMGARIYAADPRYENMHGSWIWSGGEVHMGELKRGLLHLSQEAAIAHAKAIILSSGGSID